MTHLEAIRKKSLRERGFTLMEVAVSVGVLGLAFTAIITLQAKTFAIYTDESNRLHAALYAQYLMAMIEIDNEPPATGSESGGVREALSDVGFFSDELMDEVEADLGDWTYEQVVEEIDLPLAILSEQADDEDAALRRIDLTIRWGGAVGQSYSLIYFVRAKKE